MPCTWRPRSLAPGWFQAAAAVASGGQGVGAGQERGSQPAAPRQVGREDWTLGKMGRTAGVEGWGTGGWASGWASGDLRPGPESRRSLSAAHLWRDPLVWQFRLGVMGWRAGGVSLPGSGGGGGEVWLLMGVRVEETRWTHALSLRGHWVRSSGGLGPFLSSR